MQLYTHDKLFNRQICIFYKKCNSDIKKLNFNLVTSFVIRTDLFMVSFVSSGSHTDQSSASASSNHDNESVPVI